MPLVDGDDLPDFWARQAGDNLILFFAHPGTRHVRYPMERGQADRLESTRRGITIHAHGRAHKLDLSFPHNQSLLLKVTPESLFAIDIG